MTNNIIRNIGFFVVLTGFLVSCQKKGCVDVLASNYDQQAQIANNKDCLYKKKYAKTLKVRFNHYYNDLEIFSEAVKAGERFQNFAGNNHDIKRFKYVVSNLTLYKSSTDSVVIDDIQYVDFFDTTTYSKIWKNQKIPQGHYIKMRLTVGLSPSQNKTGQYPFLSSKGLLWPRLRGGGYQCISFLGECFDLDIGAFSYRLKNVKEGGVIHHPHFYINVDKPIDIKSDNLIVFDFDIYNLMKSPYVWDIFYFAISDMSELEKQFIIKANGKLSIVFKSYQSK